MRHLVWTGGLPEVLLLALQLYQVMFLWIHDWIPIGRLNDVTAVRRQDSLATLVLVTLIQSVPYSIGLFYSVKYFSHPYPVWLTNGLWIGYVLLLAGQIRAWWVPYLVRPDAVRAERYRAMFGETHAFLPVRHGIVPNTAHLSLHVVTAATLVVLWLKA